MKKLLLVLSLVLLLGLSFYLGRLSAKENSESVPAPSIHAIAEDHPAAEEQSGASALAGSLNHIDTDYYRLNDFYNLKSDGSLHVLSNFDTYQQTTEYTCGAASALMVLHRFGNDDWDEMQLAEHMKTDPNTGTSVEALAELFSSLGWQVDVHTETEPRFETEEQLEAYLIEKLDAGIPVMVDWLDWAGHWQVIIGFDTCGTESTGDDVLILADPYDTTDHYQDGYYTYPLGRFFYMWCEGPNAQKSEPYQQPFVCAQPIPSAGK